MAESETELQDAGSLMRRAFEAVAAKDLDALRGRMARRHRRGFRHIAARITPTGRRLRLNRHWSRTSALLDAITRVRTAFASLSVTATATVQAAL